VVAHLLRLKLALLRNGLRRSTWQVVGLVVAALYALGAMLGAIAGLVALSTQDPGTIRTVLVVAGSALVLAWWFVPLVAFGVDATLDPTRFVTFAIPRRTLLTGLALGGVLGIPGAATAVVVLASALSWWRTPVAALVAVPCALLSLATCLIGARATTTALAPLVGRRRYREVVAVITIIPLVLLGPLLNGVVSGLAAGRDVLPALADAAGWTPLGAAWAVPADVAAGAYGRAVLELLVAVVSLAALVALWNRALSRALVTPASSGREGSKARARGIGAFGWLPATPTGAVMARCLTYWLRDPRYAKALIVVPMIPVLLYFTAGTAGSDRGVLLITGPLIGLLMGWTISSDVAFDGTAFWTHVAAPIGGRVDRTGRVLAAGLICLPVTLALVVGTVAVTGRWAALPAMVGVSVGLLLTALGGASVVSARVVYQVPRPGESPFASQQGGSMAAAVAQLVGWAVIVAASLPEIVLASFAVGYGSVLLGVITLVVGVLLGGLLLVVGIRIGSRILDRSAPELLARMVSFG
jgi:ABC-2 type transport system permease protein